MIKRFSAIISMCVLALFIVSGCAKTGKDAARESCECVKKVLEQKTTDMSKFHDGFKKCREELMKKYEAKLKSDKKFKQEFDAEAEVCNRELEKKLMDLYKGGMGQ